MKAINLFTFTRIQKEYSTEYANLLSHREKKEKVKVHEFETLQKLVDLLESNGVELPIQENFFYSFKIEQISKEFDLLKIDKGNLVLNIELKSEFVGEDKIRKQLEQNRYYLRHLASDIRLFTFIGETQELYQYTDGNIDKVTINSLIEAMELFDSSISEGIEILFEANRYLISPLNTPQEFLDGQYFLTESQEKIKIDILSVLNEGKMQQRFFGITGKAGTGKTLLLYDIVRTVACLNNRCCVIHSGILCEGHRYLNDNWDNVDIFPAKGLNGEDNKLLAGYDFIFVDESQRIYKSAVEKIIKEVALSDRTKLAIFSYDFGQALSHTEEDRNIPDMLRVIKDFSEHKLSEKIRTSKEIASFYRNLLDLKDGARGYMNYSNIDVLYANSIYEALMLIELYEEQHGYVFISYTQSLYNKSSIDAYPDEHDTHHVIGQEYDKVMIVIDDNFRYDNVGRIQGRTHPNPDYRFYKLLYQGVSRAREKLCILVVKNYTMFQQISNIKYHMLEQYQYKENNLNSKISIKKLDKMLKEISDALVELNSEDAETIKDTVTMIKEELSEGIPKKRVICNGIKLLNLMLLKNMDFTGDFSSVQEYIEYVSQFV